MKDFGRLEDWKIKISVLWLFWIVAFLVTMMLALFEPGVIEQIIAGEFAGTKIGPEIMLINAISLLIPLAMAFLSLTLKDSMNRWANIIVGMIFTVFQLVALIEMSTLPTVYAYAVLIELSKVVAPALIVWYAWKSKQKT